MNIVRVEECLRRLGAAKEVAIDCETSGLQWTKCHVVGHVLTFGPRPDDSYYLPFRHAAGGNIEGVAVPQTKDGWDGSVHPIEKEIIRLLDRQGVKKLGHNLSFDLKHYYRLGMKFEGEFEDSIINQPLLDEYFPSFTLDACAKAFKVTPKKTGLYDYLLAKFPELKTTPKQAMSAFWRLAGDDPQAVEYAEGDGTTTWELIQKQRVALADQDLLKVHGVECRLIPVLARMTTRGVRVDEERLDAVIGEVDTRISAARRALPDDFNSRAPSQVQALMEKNGHLDWPMTKPSRTRPNGSPSFNEQWLLTNPTGKLIVDLRKLENLKASFLVPMKEQHLWKGRCHADYNQLRGDEYGTITGRLSSSNPNLQQINKRNRDLGYLHRSIFVPDEGMKWGTADWSQMEPTLLAYYSRCKVLLDGYRADPPIDAHLAVAMAVNQLSWPEMSDADRKVARETGKRINQTLLTGGGKKVIVERYGVDPNDVDRQWNAYFNRMPEIKEFQRKAANRMRDRGYVITLLGRRCRMADKDYVALNRLLQGGNADAIKLKMCEIDDYLRSEGQGCDMLTNVHDALDFQYNNEATYKRCLEIMTSFGPEDVLSVDVPVRVDHNEGDSWASATWGPQ